MERATGNVGGARKHFQRSLDILEEMVRQDPTNAGFKRDLSASLGNLGEVERTVGSLALAGNYFQRSLDIVEEMVGQDPKNASLKRDLSVSLNRLGNVERAGGNLGGARKHFQRSLEIVEEMVGQDPTNASLKFDLVLSHGKLFELEQGQDAAAYKRHLLAADKLLTELADSGHLEGWAEREQARKIVTQHLNNLDP